MFSRWLPRPNTRDEAAILTQVLTDTPRIERNLSIEVGERHDEKRTGNETLPLPWIEPSPYQLKPPYVRERPDNRLGQDDNGNCKDDGNHTRSIDTQGDIGALATHHLAPHDLPCILHRDAPFRLLDHYHAADCDDQQCHIDDQPKDVGFPPGDEGKLL